MSRGLHSARSLSATAICVFAAQLVACSDASPSPAEGASDGGNSGQTPGGSAGSGGDGSEQGGSLGNAGKASEGGSAEGGASAGGTPAEAGSGPAEGGSPSDAGGGGSGNEGEGGSGGNTIAYCVYDDDVSYGGADGAGGAGAAIPNITLRSDPFLGQYLADGAGKTLYLYGKDQTGDCENAPISGCTTPACLSAWPPFFVQERVLAEGLDASRFGSVDGPGGPITTYLGWPLYTYATDTEPGMIKGQGKQGLWFAAELELPALIPMRAVDATVNHLATSRGYPLYVHALDTLGSSESAPVSACTGECAVRHVPLIGSTISVASAVEPSDLSLFLRPDNQLQLAYKGAPLYLDAQTPRPGGLVNPVPEQWGVALK